ncbi:hypothetical protein KSP40_PGU017198 [Platanthera guangdongensis]|uniref:Uncharacterized protein n=1 Tax=Platanthera guangdongensis TaxID=2320717 RepID=A0ABR2N401_9ASPA
MEVARCLLWRFQCGEGDGGWVGGDDECFGAVTVGDGVIGAPPSIPRCPHRPPPRLHHHRLLNDLDLQVATTHGVPQLEFDGFSFFSHCLKDAYLKQNLIQILALDDQTIVFHVLLDHIEFRRSQLPNTDNIANDTTLSRIWIEAMEANRKSFDVVVNIFYELEPDYAEHFRNVMGEKAWGVGPVALSDDKNTNEPVDLFRPHMSWPTLGSHEKELEWSGAHPCMHGDKNKANPPPLT